jgi:hypothetical protein
MQFSLLACGLLALLEPSGARADLLDYMKKPEPHFAWKLKQKSRVPQAWSTTWS